MSARGEAGQQTSVPIVITNTGSAPADAVELSSTAPSGWKIEFEPKTVDKIDPNKDAEVTARITPTDKSLAGDYMATLARVLARRNRVDPVPRHGHAPRPCGALPGVGIIGVALLFLVGAVARFGRR